MLGFKILKGASKLIALNEAELGHYLSMGVPKNKIKIIPNGINLNEHHNLTRKGEFKKKYFIKDDEKIILYLGRINKTKGINLLIESFEFVSKKINNVKLVIVGPDDGFLGSLKKLVKTLDLENNTLFTGPVYGNDKYEAFIDAHVFVTPNYSGFPITFLESCNYGVPIITTNKGDKLDWIDNNVGYVVKYDKNKLSNVICKVLSDEDLRNKFGKNGRNIVKTKFNWLSICNDIEKTYLENV